MVWILLTMGSGVGYLASMVVATITGRRIANSLGTVDTEPKEVAVVAAHGLWSGALQLAAAICRHYWPIALVLAMLSRRCRNMVLVAAVIDGVVDWVKRHGNADDDTKPVGLVSYLLLKRWTISPRNRPVDRSGSGTAYRRPQAADPDLKQLCPSAPLLLVGAVTC